MTDSLCCPVLASWSLCLGLFVSTSGPVQLVCLSLHPVLGSGSLVSTFCPCQWVCLFVRPVLTSGSACLYVRFWPVGLLVYTSGPGQLVCLSLHYVERSIQKTVFMVNTNFLVAHASLVVDDSISAPVFVLVGLQWCTDALRFTSIAVLMFSFLL